MNRPAFGYAMAVLALLILALTWASFFAPIESTRFAVTLRPAGANARVLSVIKGSDAERAGIRAGDIVDLQALTLSERYRLLVRSSPAGLPLRLRLQRNGEVRNVTIYAEPRPSPSPPDFVFAALLAATVTLLIIAVVVARRPSLATVALVIYGAGAAQSFPFIALFTGLPDPLFGAFAVFVNVVVAQMPLFALLIFIVRFPTDPQTASARKTAFAAGVIFWIAAAIFTVQLILEPMAFVSWNAFDVWSTIVPLVIVLGFTANAYQKASGEDRRRVAWVLVGLAVAAVAYTIFDFVDFGTLAAGQSFAKVQTLQDIATLAQAALPVALGYSILRHRVLDIGFALNRTVVYGVMTAIVLIVVSFVDWLTSRLLSEERLALAVEALVTIGFGVTLNWIHGRTERLIDRMVFRARHIAEKRIEYRVGALAFAPTAAFVDDALAVEAPRILDLYSAAVFRREVDSQPFARQASQGWNAGDVTEIGDDSMLVTTLRSLERPIVLDDVAITQAGFPHGALRPALAIPVFSQHELLGFALFGNRLDGALPDPEEIALLARLCGAAGNAYAMVEARRLREHAASLERLLVGTTNALGGAR